METTRRILREATGALLVLAALAVLFGALVRLSLRDYLGAVILVLTGLSVLQAGVELLKPSAGEP